MQIRIPIFSFLLCLLIFSAQAQEYSLLLKGGHVIDPKNNIDAVMDIALVGDSIASVAENIPENQAEKVVDATGLYVTPGLIDIHSHNFHGTEPDAYLSNSFTALPPDGFTFRVGVTTVVDVGGAGWRNFSTFKEQTIDQSKTRVLSFLNIVGSGMKGGAIEQNLQDMDGRMTGMLARQHPEIVGVKVAHYSGPEWKPVEEALIAAEMADIPVMIDFGGNIPPLSLESLLMERLRPGDIFTHTFAHVPGRIPIVDERGKVRPYVYEAQKRGVIFDVGHGGGSFLFRQAIPAMKEGFRPNTISTDLHTGSMNAGMKDQLNIMSKFLNMEMPLKEVITASTWKSAQVIQREELGHLSEGAVADIAVFSLQEGAFGFIDSEGFRMEGTQKLQCELTIRAGDVVYDLNGISRPPWIVE
ncbi:amidohydrolase/deacetylase family metallohydrolase [Catalinimonas niigatensis]|uniref:amidohydrolase/deacetylase family metallohydrolase n=1 Tax=Catalinimonas niigatensis TaxID=1397264 RepID=UPI00266631CB|nr:amidohydrolase/deacetylase family metallohydrolase [Catalinimonas niigatensis]WPP48629.1 amidohydrolase/deacetylase family metallohydrolase [Catalinimonas niigatensis]